MLSMTDKIIPFDGQERLLAKVRAYLSALDELIRDGDQGIDLLLKAFDAAEEELKVKIVIMLGTLARPRVVWSLLDIMRNQSQSENIRQAAAIQISVIGASLKNKEELIQQLFLDLESESSFMRANAAFALGWEGNFRAAPELIDCLSDDDIEVQQAAVNALSNLRDESLFIMLAQRLQKASKEQQRSILYNLGHFPSQQSHAAQICKTFLHHNDADLRYDALVVLHGISDTVKEQPIYEHCLKDNDARIRELALMRLQEIDRTKLKPLLPKICKMVKDPHARVRQAATRLVHHIESISLAIDH
jgi:HEAT repeat protein